MGPWPDLRRSILVGRILGKDIHDQLSYRVRLILFTPKVNPVGMKWLDSAVRRICIPVESLDKIEGDSYVRFKAKHFVYHV